MRFTIKNDSHGYTRLSSQMKKTKAWPSSQVKEFINKFKYMVVSDQAFRGSKAAKLDWNDTEYNFYTFEGEEYLVCKAALGDIGMQPAPKILFFRGFGKKG